MGRDRDLRELDDDEIVVDKATKLDHRSSNVCMLRHVLGFFLGLSTLATGIFTAPRVFHETGRDRGSLDGQFCSATGFSSHLFEEITLWSCGAYNDEYPVRDEFEHSVGRYKVLERSASRAVVSYDTREFRGFCVLRLDGSRINDICALSLEPILDFEKQHFRDAR